MMGGWQEKVRLSLPGAGLRRGLRQKAGKLFVDD